MLFRSPAVYGTYSVYNDPTLDPTYFSNGANHIIHNDTSITLTNSPSGAIFNTTSLLRLQNLTNNVNIINNNVSIAQATATEAQGLSNEGLYIKVGATGSGSAATYDTGWTASTGAFGPVSYVGNSIIPRTKAWITGACLSSSSNTTIFYLPIDVRPLTDLSIIVTLNSVPKSAFIQASDGRVQINSTITTSDLVIFNNHYLIQ